jgi:DNA-binding GntR family transcriptional regulator
MRAAVAVEDRAAFVEADLSLHATLCRGSGNERLYRMSETQTGLLRTLIRLEVERVVHQFEPVMEEHANLVAEIRSGDRMRAAVAVWTLFRRTSRVLIGEPEPAKEMTGKGRSRSATM